MIASHVREVLDHHGDTIVRGAYDGTYDKTNLPDGLILSNYFSVRDGKIVSLVIINNQPAGYSYRGHGAGSGRLTAARTP